MVEYFCFWLDDFNMKPNTSYDHVEKKKLGSVLAIVNKSKINFSYEHLEKATNYFHISNKLGQGGSGAVYKVIIAAGNLFFY